MGYIRELNSNPDTETFPGAKFQQVGIVPIAQCEETQIDITNCSWAIGQSTITLVGEFAGIDLTGKKVTITIPPGEAGTYDILSNTDDTLLIDHTFGTNAPPSVGQVHDAGQAYLTRDIQSFARFISNAGYAYTIKGNTLWTDCPDGTLQNACSNNWDPLT